MSAPLMQKLERVRRAFKEDSAVMHGANSESDDGALCMILCLSPANYGAWNTLG